MTWRFGGDPGKSAAVIRTGSDDADHGSAMAVARKVALAAVYEVLRLRYAPAQLGMVCVDAGVDHRDPDAFALAGALRRVRCDKPRGVGKMGMGITLLLLQTREHLILLHRFNTRIGLQRVDQIGDQRSGGTLKTRH